VTSSWFFLSTLNYGARPTTHQMQIVILVPCFWFNSTSLCRFDTFQWGTPKFFQ